jgi:hypothetical protein
MATDNFIVKNGLDVANGSFTANSTEFTYGSIVANSTMLVVGNNSVNTTIEANGILVNGSPLGVNTSFGYTFTNNITFSITTTFGNSTVNTTINSTSFSGTALTSNNASFLNGNTAAQIIALANTYANTAYANAAILASNASYLTSGIVNNALLGTTGTPQFGSIGVGVAAQGSSSIYATGNIEAYYSSDINLKTNIQNLQNALAKLQMLNGVEFDWTDEFIKQRGPEDKYFNRRHDVGVIAQNVEPIIPEVVATREDGTKAVKYEKIIPLLIEAVKELANQVQAKG